MPLPFFQNQNAPGRIGYITDKIDEEYEEQKRLAAAQSSQHNDSLSLMRCTEDEDTSFQMNIEDSVSLSKSIGHTESYSNSIADALMYVQLALERLGSMMVQPHQLHQLQKSYGGGKIRLVKEDVKNAVARVSFATGTSIDKSLQSAQIICKEVYGNVFYLTADKKKSITW